MEPLTSGSYVLLPDVLAVAYAQPPRVVVCAGHGGGRSRGSRTGYDDDVLYVRRVFEREDGVAIAQELRRAVLEEGAFRNIGDDGSELWRG